MLISLGPPTVFAITLVGLTRLLAKYKRSATFLTHHLRSLTIAQTSEDKLTYTVKITCIFGRTVQIAAEKSMCGPLEVVISAMRVV